MRCVNRTAHSRWAVLHLRRAQCRPQSFVGDDSGRLWRLRSSIDRQELLFGNFGQAQRAAIRFSHEAVNHVVRVKEKSGHRPVRSDAVDVRTLEGARARARNVELNDARRAYRARNRDSHLPRQYTIP